MNKVGPPTTKIALLCSVFCSMMLIGCEKRGSVENNAPINSLVAMNTAAEIPSSEERDDRDLSLETLSSRLTAIDHAVVRWRNASNLQEAHKAAEEARNLVVGPHGPYYGDGDRDGTIEGSTTIGLLPGKAGQAGLAKMTDGECVVRDVLGGSWEKPSHRWSQFEAVIKAWTPSRNTMPTLPSHPQRIAGWASLALASRSLANAREFGEHAQIHSNVSQTAQKACKD